MDNPFHAEQRLLTVDLAGDPLVVFGAAGRGKTTFLKSLVLALAAHRSPAELHIFMLDFGRGGLKAIAGLPHCGATHRCLASRTGWSSCSAWCAGQMNERQERLAPMPRWKTTTRSKQDNPETHVPGHRWW